MQDRVSPFIFPSRLLLGADSAAQVGDEARRLRGDRAVVVCDPGVASAGLVDAVLGSLQGAGIACEVFDGVRVEPTVESADGAAAMARDGDFDLVVGLGGGSSLDTAKAVSLLVRHSGSIGDFLGVDRVPGPGLPLILMPTTSGSGSEATPNAIFTDPATGVKEGVVSAWLMAEVVIVDPLMTVTVPSHVTASTGIDALAHAIESYTSIRATDHTRMYALEAIRLIGLSLRAAVADGEDLKARGSMSRASFYAGASITNAGTNAVHALAYPLGGRFGLSHGLASALLLPHVMGFNAEGDPRRFAEVACALDESLRHLSARDAATKGVVITRQLTQDIGLPQRLRDVGVPKEAIPEMVGAAAQIDRLLRNNPRPITSDDIERLYRQAH